MSLLKGKGSDFPIFFLDSTLFCLFVYLEIPVQEIVEWETCRVNVFGNIVYLFFQFLDIFWI